MEERKFGLSGFALKWIAMICMLTDHMGAVLFPQYIQMRMIGRIAFPIYCFLLVEGAVHTSNIRKYIGRLFLFALISELPFDLAFYRQFSMEHQNVFFTLLLGLIAISQFQQNIGKLNCALNAALAMALAGILHTDYSYKGVALIICFYLLYQYVYLKQAVFMAGNWLVYGIGIQTYACLAAIPMLLYNGKRGPNMKYFFYIFYPAHLLILYFIKVVILE